MPVVRSVKLKERKLQEQVALAARILETGFEMFPCSNCERWKTKCVLSDNESSGRCAECVRRGKKCDVKGIPIGDWESLSREEARLKSEEEGALRLMRESLAHIERLRKQQDFLKSKGVGLTGVRNWVSQGWLY
jgi:hypothetical protein